MSVVELSARRQRRRPRLGAWVLWLPGVAALVVVVTGVPLVGAAVLAVPPVVVILACRRAAVSVLAWYVVLLFVVPSVLVGGAIAPSGTPAEIAAIGAFCWWAASRVTPTLGGAR